MRFLYIPFIRPIDTYIQAFHCLKATSWQLLLPSIILACSNIPVPAFSLKLDLSDFYHKCCLGSYLKVTLREIGKVSIGVPQTRKSLVKGERFIRFVWRTWVWLEIFGYIFKFAKFSRCLWKSRFFKIYPSKPLHVKEEVILCVILQDKWCVIFLINIMHDIPWVHFITPSSVGCII